MKETFNMEIPIDQQKQNDVYSYGFDKSLNRQSAEMQTPEVNMTEKVRDALLQAGIDINTVNSISSGDFNRDDFHWYTIFESLDGFGTNGSVTISMPDVVLTTGAIINDSAEIYKYIRPTTKFSWNKDRKLRITVSFRDSTNQNIYVVMGSGQAMPDEVAKHIGWKVTNGTLYGSVANGTAETVLDCGGLVEDAATALDINYIAGESAEFIVNGTSKGKITANLPSGGTGANDWVMDVKIRTTEALAKTIWIDSWEFWQAS